MFKTYESILSKPAFTLRPYSFQPSPHSFFPEGIRKTRGIVNKSTKPKEMKMILKPFLGLELKGDWDVA